MTLSERKVTYEDAWREVAAIIRTAHAADTPAEQVVKQLADECNRVIRVA